MPAFGGGTDIGYLFANAMLRLVARSLRRADASMCVCVLTIVGRRRSLVLYGPTRLGKTLWARSLGRHAYFGGLFSLDEDVSDVDYAVFDDMQGGIKFFHSYKFWLGAQSQFYATDKYKGKRLIDWGKPSIYISNNNPLEDEGVDHDWMLGNCDFVEITESLLVPEESGFRSEG